MPSYTTNDSYPDNPRQPGHVIHLDGPGGYPDYRFRLRPNERAVERFRRRLARAGWDGDELDLEVGIERIVVEAGTVPIA